VREQPMGCSSNAQCAAPTGVCVLEERTCVQCTVAEASACVGTTPVCGTDNTCGGCSQHSDCASAVCLPDGACGSDVNVAYVDPAGTGTTCTKAAPCQKVDDALKTSRPFVKFRGVTDEAVVVDNRTVTFLADPGAQLTRSSGGAIVTVKDTGTSLAVYDLAISDAPNNANGYGVLVPTGGGTPSVSLTRVTLQNNPGGGISSSGATVTVTQSTVSGNQGGGISASGGTLTVTQSTVSGNQGGGISVAGVATTFSITDNIMIYNGRALGAQASNFGGAAITSNTAGSKFERNTVAFNESNGLTFRGGTSCNAPLATAAGNLLFHNAEPDGGGGIKNDLTTQANLSGGCSFGNTLAVATDANNLGFQSPLIAPFDFHLTAATPATIRDAGGACTGVDIDGDTRPQGVACDLGADEYKAN
jgi:Right handed beta helix region